MDILSSRIPNVDIENIGSTKKPLYAVKGFVELTSWTGYFLYDEAYQLIQNKTVANGRVDLWIDGEILPDGSFPISEQQVNSYRYLIEYEQRVKQSILENLKSEFPRLLSEDYASWEQDGPDFPAVSALTPEFDFKNYIGPESISINDDVKDESAYLTWHFRCRWDIEHGFGIITHKDRVIDIAPEADVWKIYKDNGTYEQEQERYRNIEWKLPKKKKWWQFY